MKQSRKYKRFTSTQNLMISVEISSACSCSSENNHDIMLDLNSTFTPINCRITLPNNKFLAK